MEIIQLSPYRPYLLRAFYEWLLDNQLTPHIVVDISIDGVVVPIEFAHNGEIILNISPHAVTNLILGNDNVQFNASFGGISRQIVVPITAILAIYASENINNIMLNSKLFYEQLTLVNNDRTKGQMINIIISVINSTHPLTQTEKPKNEPLPPQRGNGRPLLRIVK